MKNNQIQIIMGIAGLIMVCLGAYMVINSIDGWFVFLLLGFIIIMDIPTVKGGYEEDEKEKDKPEK